MRKSFLSTAKINKPGISLILLLIVTMALMGLSKPVGAQAEIIYVTPTSIDVPQPGQNFTVDINIANITTTRKLQGYEFKLWFNTTILNATEVVTGPITPLGTILGPIDPVTYEWIPLQNVSDGFVWVIAALPFGQAFSGSGIAMTVNFTALAIGDSALHLNGTVLGDMTGQPIPHQTGDAAVTVYPEFPVALIMPLLMTTTLAAALLAKMFWSRKRKDALTAE